MKYRKIPKTDLEVSEVGFGLWTVSTGWWGKFTEGEALALMREGFDHGITLFDAADTYGNGASEEYLGKAFSAEGLRDDIVIATKIGYDFNTYGGERRGQRAIPQNFDPQYVRDAVEAALKRLKTDRIDILQLHNITMPQVEDDALWETLAELQREGKLISYGAALGPAIGWLYEGIRCVQERDVQILQHIYNMLEQFPGRPIMDAATDAGKDTKFLIRVTHSSGMLEGHYTEDTTFPPSDHRSHRPRSWLLNGLKKIETLKFLVNENRTLGQVALQWLLADDRIIGTLPNIYNSEQVKEFAAAPDTPPLTEDEVERVRELFTGNFGVEEAPMKFKGTMELAAS